ncbi:MAG: hypothetical protein GC189_07300 [Alphaproteobacteria bacterium]|nr:hypothetical protein [Alphaproteobacteria bacterium]
MADNLVEAEAASSHAAAPDRGERPPAPKRGAGLRLAAGALVVLTATLATAWFFRLPLAEAFVRSRLAAMGLQSDFDLLTLDFSHIRAANLTLGPPSDPYFSSPRLEADIAWSWLRPRLDHLRISDPVARLRASEDGMAFGPLRPSGAAPGPRPELPDMGLDISGGSLVLETPFGTLPFSVTSSGRFGRDWTAQAALPRTTTQSGVYVLTGASAALALRSTEAGLALSAEARAAELRWEDWRSSGAAATVSLQSAADLESFESALRFTFAQASGPSADARGGAVAMDGRFTLGPEGFAPERWQGSSTSSFQALSIAGLVLDQAEVSGVANAEGAEFRGGGDVTASGFRFGVLQSQGARAAVSFAGRSSGRGAVNLNANLELPRGRLDRDGLQFVRDAWPNLDGLPIAPLMGSGEAALVRALSDFSVRAPVSAALFDGVGAVTLTEPVALRGASGGVIRAAPLREDQAMFTLRLADQDLDAAALLTFEGGGLPPARLAIEDLSGGGATPIEASGRLAIADWRQSGSRLRAPDLAVEYAGRAGGGEITVSGDAVMSGPTAGVIVHDLAAPLDLAVAWGGGFRVAPRNGPLDARIRLIEAPGLLFSNARLRVLPGAGGAFVSSDAAGRMSGGFTLDNVAMTGRAAGEDASPARIAARRIEGRFGGGADAIRLDLSVASPSGAIALAPDRTVTFAAATLTATNVIADGSWRMEGQVAEGEVRDPALPAVVSALSSAFTATPEGDQAIVRFSDAQALITGLALPGGDPRPLFNPMRLERGEGVMRDGRVTLEGALALNAGGRALGTVNAAHDFANGSGDAQARMADLRFGERLQPYQISELSRGAIENVRGVVDATLRAAWTPDALETGAQLGLRDVSLATKTIPIIEHVSGDVAFNDLIALTTPPGQRVTIGVLNPGVAVANGAVQFQMLPEGQVRIEDARFGFAQGVLRVQPTTITLGAEETRVVLSLSEVDVAALLEQLNTPDLRASGTVEGRFPLVLTERSTDIIDGELHAVGGGEISYVGTAGDSMTGPAQLAFEALRAFEYDTLALTLNGSLGGDVVTDIRFRGRNEAAADLGAITAAPGGVQLNARGIPFVFNVNISAPFRSLADTAATITDGRRALDQFGRGEEAPLDPDASTPE